MNYENTPLRVLHITEMLSAAGIESFIMNMYRHIDRSKIQFDFLILRDQKEFYDDEIRSLGGRKYCVHSSKKNTLLRIWDESKQIEEFLKKHKYHIVHIHYTTPLRAPYLLAAKRVGIPVRIYHAHSAVVSGKSKLKLLIYNYYRNKIEKWGTDWFACSQAAAEWIFPDKLLKSGNVKVVYNGIDTVRFQYSENKRNKIRNELKLGESFTIIHTGRFIEQKNQMFILDIFKKLLVKCPDAKLLLLGTGDLLDKTKEHAATLNILENVQFLGVKSNVEEYLCAADCYIMPSLYEGLPVAAVEAQCAGLPCILSKNITNEVNLGKKVSFVSLSAPISEWCDKILEYRNVTRMDGSRDVVACGYGIQYGAEKLQKFYENKGK